MPGKDEIYFTLEKTETGLQLRYSENFRLTYVNMLFTLWQTLDKNEHPVRAQIAKITDMDELHNETMKWMDRKKFKKVKLSFDEVVFMNMIFRLDKAIYSSAFAYDFMRKIEEDSVGKKEEHRKLLVEGFSVLIHNTEIYIEDYPEYHYRKNHFDKVFPQQV